MRAVPCRQVFSSQRQHQVPEVRAKHHAECRQDGVCAGGTSSSLSFGFGCSNSRTAVSELDDTLSSGCSWVVVGPLVPPLAPRVELLLPGQ